MKVCIYGVGAVGGHLAARLCAAGKAEVSVIARGAQLDAIRRNGITLKSGGKEIHGKPAVATDDPAGLGKQDLVIVTLKAHAAPGAAAPVERLLAADGCVMFPLNGLTWWWRYGRGPKQEPLPLLDPQAELWTRLRERTLGCVIYSPNEVVSPGVVSHVGGNRFVIGEPTDEKTSRVQAVVDLFNASAITAEVSPDIRAELLRKFAGNAWSNPLGALTGRVQSEISQDADLKQIAMRIMRETLEVAAALGWDLRNEIDVEKNVSRASLGATPSMSQDVLLGRPLEVEAHLGQTQAFARELGVPVPTIDVVLPLLRGLDASIRSRKS
ncbi:MAG TPA: 2-dehydropantoate 2-reductase [Burkholderiales bacterium]|nr:2-dehydropantoate 2-reductase [Burkholderiales bacterium]